MERKSLPVDVEWKAGASPGEVEGYASVFGNIDGVGDVVMPGAFRKTISDWRHASQPMPLTADHNLTTDGLIGSVRDLKEDSHGLWFKALFSRSEKAQRVRQDILDGHIRGSSFIYEAINAKPGRFAGKAVRFLHELRLHEITIAQGPLIVNPLAGVTAAKAVVSGSWDGSPSRFTDDQYRRSCLIDRGGDAPVKERCSLPIREPNGNINRNALGAAAAALAGARGGVANVSPELRRRAARALIRAYGEADMEPPESLRRIAGMGAAAQTDWYESMGHAMAITDEFARKAAVDELVANYQPDTEETEPAATPDGDSTGDDAATTPEAGDTSTLDATAAYAVAFLAQQGPSDGTPDGEPPEALPAQEIAARAEAERLRVEMDRLERDLTGTSKEETHVPQ